MGREIKKGDMVTFDADDVEGGLWEVISIVPAVAAKVRIKDRRGTQHTVDSAIVTRVMVNQIIAVVCEDIRNNGQLRKVITGI